MDERRTEAASKGAAAPFSLFISNQSNPTKEEATSKLSDFLVKCK
jgi:hypothetical protein